MVPPVIFALLYSSFCVEMGTYNHGTPVIFALLYSSFCQEMGTYNHGTPGNICTIVFFFLPRDGHIQSWYPRLYLHYCILLSAERWAHTIMVPRLYLHYCILLSAKRWAHTIIVSPVIFALLYSSF